MNKDNYIVVSGTQGVLTYQARRSIQESEGWGYSDKVLRGMLSTIIDGSEEPREEGINKSKQVYLRFFGALGGMGIKAGPKLYEGRFVFDGELSKLD